MTHEDLTKLKDREKHLDLRIIYFTKRRQWLLYIGLCILCIPCIIYFKDDPTKYLYTIPISISFILIVIYFGISSRIRLKKRELRDLYLDKDIAELDIEFKDSINKNIMYAEKTLRLHNDQLKKYYDLNLNQNSLIFRLGILCIVMGFIITLITLLFIFQSEDPSEKIVAGVLGGIGSILSNYVAVLYLKMNSSVSESLKEFHNKLSDTHKILISSSLISKIDDKTLRENTYSEVAKLISCKDLQSR